MYHKISNKPSFFLISSDTGTKGVMMSIEKAMEDIRDGKIVLVYDFDDREKETDMTIASEFITHETLRTFRKMQADSYARQRHSMSPRGSDSHSCPMCIGMMRNILCLG